MLMRLVRRDAFLLPLFGRWVLTQHIQDAAPNTNLGREGSGKVCGYGRETFLRKEIVW